MSTRYLLAGLLAGAAASPFANIESRTLPFGSLIYSCTVPNTVALTFDDGPFDYTEHVLDLFDQYDAKATFFLNGHNWGYMTDRPDTVVRMINEGHQVGSHTWSHPDLALLTPEQVTDQMIELEHAFIEVIGKIPTYMRPPFFSYNSETLRVLGDLGYHVIHANIDTLDWSFQDVCKINTSIDLFVEGITNGGSIVLAHDVHALTAYTLVPAMLEAVKLRGLRAVTVGECLGDPQANWYRDSRDGTTPPGTGEPQPPTGGVHPDGICGGPNKYVCGVEGYPCCSAYGYCGFSIDHCGAGCNPEFGTCGFS
ncbi:hypothetical protein SAPIO_CDS0289 [Scedosporium apiospermum]|uniref:Chitin deacetylase n=1 Tax=Pseudallescheria apiosperma TaxID=563466 RepID=A0A084GHX8_PSEDA|nr:uncharacterized protein SAPIO_CDS0289 [Scedosporium apiospermum]KEZ46940.1 hypothetical protein SAPIO_CDS0289 [Scedosporium apiospermum]